MRKAWKRNSLIQCVVWLNSFGQNISARQSVLRLSTNCDILGYMKFFISGQINDATNVRQIMNSVIAAGHEITHDWTTTDTFFGGRDNKLNHPEESGIRAYKDIQGVVDCDIYVLLSSNKDVGKGMYVELGAALALNQALGKPRVFIVGPMNHLSVFYLHPAAQRAETVDEILRKIARAPQK